MSYRYKKGNIPEFMPPISLDCIDTPGLIAGYNHYEVVHVGPDTLINKETANKGGRELDNDGIDRNLDVQRP